MAHRSPIVLRRRIAREIKGLRQRTGLSLEAVSELTSITKSTLSRMEQGHTAPKVSILRQLLQTYRAPDAKREELERLAVEANRRGWWSQQYGGVEVPDWITTYVSLESEAQGIQIFEQIVPGLLQTEEYARALIASGIPDGSPETVEGRIRLRMFRQERIAAGLSIRAVIDEAALHRVVGGRQVMAGQMRRLAQLAGQPSVSLQVLPFAQLATPVLGSPFAILSFADGDPAVVYLEAIEDALYVENPDQVELFRSLYEQLSRAALAPAESAALFTTLAQRYSQDG
ncbi:MAG TPA: helix-turn-helix transcriptional regulator [Micromonosporaceae bacterium]|nr:helix-turn-helix transcriptional regulator [Micromonosporaceae bacterium]